MKNFFSSISKMNEILIEILLWAGVAVTTVGAIIFFIVLYLVWKEMK